MDSTLQTVKCSHINVVFNTVDNKHIFMNDWVESQKFFRDDSKFKNMGSSFRDGDS